MNTTKELVDAKATDLAARLLGGDVDIHWRNSNATITYLADEGKSYFCFDIDLSNGLSYNDDINLYSKENPDEFAGYRNPRSERFIEFREELCRSIGIGSIIINNSVEEDFWLERGYRAVDSAEKRSLSGRAHNIYFLSHAYRKDIKQ